MNADAVETFFDGVIFLLIGLTGFFTVLVVLIESKMANVKLDRVAWAIILRSSGIAAVFTWAFLRFFFPALEIDPITWALRVFLLVGALNYLFMLAWRVKDRHNLRARDIVTYPFRGLFGDVERIRRK